MAIVIVNACKDWQSHMSLPPPKAIVAALAGRRRHHRESDAVVAWTPRQLLAQKETP